jgi:hypothetical protein
MQVIAHHRSSWITAISTRRCPGLEDTVEEDSANQIHRLDQSPSAQAERLRKEASCTPPGVRRDQMRLRARQIEAASRTREWRSSPGPAPPNEQPDRRAQHARLSCVHPGLDGHIRRRHDLRCRSDAEAIKLAKQFVNVHDVELWQPRSLARKRGKE